MSDVLQMGLIGCGGIMGVHAESLKQLWEKGYRSFLIPAVCDCDANRAEDMVARIAEWQGTQPRVYTFFEEMLSQEHDMRAVDLALVHRIHHSVAVPCLKAGKHVTIEKPLGLTMRACRAIIDAAKRHKRVLQVAENYRRSPQERAINWAIREGMIGDLRMIFWLDVGERLWHWGWRDDVEQAGGGWSMDGGVHFADLFRYHVGEVKELYAVSTAYHPFRYAKPETMEEPIPATTEDTTVAVLTFENGVTGQWSSTNTAPGAGFSERVLYGSKGSIKWGSGLQTRDKSISMEELTGLYMDSVSWEEKERWFPLGVDDMIATELHEFVEAVLHKGPLEIDGVEGMKDEAISLALYESSVLDQPVEISKIENCEIEAYQRQFNEQVGL
ncbi:MAG TPA: Gfo/Idh/MocA family oxidoreductase [Armatimonadota bacterium]|nr:Gfo/Idh/MocA family oxidoreductase [Armatimonadota bacterium]